MPLRVIGAGFGRTGTDSMREALEILGFAPCHHMSEVNRDPEQKRLWRALVKGAEPDWERLLGGYAACVDFPSVWYWRDLIRAYPEAKVVLTWRDPESWWESYSRTIRAFASGGNDRESLGVALVGDQVFGGRPDDRGHVLAVYEAHVAAVKATVAPERLLVHALGDGWGPLCAHLGVPVPEVPYPRLNSTADFTAAVERRRAAAPDQA
jgi:hypothetical protein